MLNPTEVKKEIEKFRKEVGPRAYISGFISSDEGADFPIHLSLYPHGLCAGRKSLSVHADYWEEAISKIRHKWTEHAAEHRRQTIHTIALKIISLTQEFGECNEAALRGAEFTPEEVQTWGAEACKLATEMAGRGPFKIRKAPKANAA